MNNLMDVLSKAPAVSSNVLQMTKALANLAAQGSNVGAAGTSLAKSVNNAGAAMDATTKRARSFSSVLGSIYQKIFWLTRSGDKLWNSIESSMDYIETLNYFNAAFGQVADAAAEQWKEAGYASAEEYYNSFSSRAKELTSKMTGFSVNDDGTLTATGSASLGIDPNKLMNYQAMFGQMSSSMGVASETALKLSQALTEIGGDLASVKNMDFDKVWNDMASGLAGMSRTLDKYGVNIRNVNLQQKLLDLGINENIASLNQNDKALLRAIILLDSTRYAWGDLADTLDQPANQLCLLESNFNNLSRTIGNLFLPVVSKVLPYVNGLAIALQRLFSWIGGLLGIDMGGITSSVGSSDFDFSGLIEDTDDLTGSLEDAAKAADKLRKGIRSFDELNVITTQEDSGAGTAGGGGISSGLLDAAFDKAFSEYQAAWDEAFANMENRADDFADKVEKYLQPVKDIIQDFAVGDFFKAGQDTSNLAAGIFNFFADAIDNVDWYGIGENIGDYLEGIEWIKVLGSVGHFIWEALKASLELWAGAFDVAPIETAVLAFAVMPNLLKLITGTKFSKGLSNLFGKFKNFYSTAKELGKGNVFSGLSGAIDQVRDNMGLLNKVAITAVAGFAEYKIISDTTENLVKGTENLVSGVAKIGGAAATAGTAMYVALGPAGAVAAAITGLTAGLIGIDNAFIEIRNEAREREEIEKYGDTLENISIKAQEASSNLLEASDARLAAVANTGEIDVSYIETLADKYFELSQKIGLSADEQSELKLASEKLVGYFPELEEFYDSTTGLLDVQRETLEELVEQKEKELMLSAISDQWEAALKDQIEAQNNLRDNTNNLKTATSELSAAYAEMEEYQKSFADPSMANLQDYWDKIGELTLAVETYTEATSGAKEALETVNNEVENYSTMYSDWSNGAKEKGEDFGIGYAKGIEESADAALAEAKKMVSSAMDGMAEEQESNSPSKKTKELGKYAVEGYNLGILANEKSTLMIASTYVSNVIHRFSQLADSLGQIGKDAMSGLYNGLASMESSLYTKTEEIAGNVAKTIRTTLDIHSPSRVMFELGEFTMEGFQLGMENLYGNMQKSVEEFGGTLQFDIAPPPQPAYADYYKSYAFPAPEYSNYSYYDSQNDFDTSETNALLRQQNELLVAILQKPNIDKNDVFDAARAVYKDKASRRYGSSTAFDPVWG
ncbi:MAG TPA: hypothetical protein H9742_14185 [Candidatus Acetatifactor stercoripullorum]|uniref:Uncharacterized protein n=1 Tax=Candidatus Acetatifactor stercoripullorum TaxID=2838414 RepID=A0A9D1R803_9FIRM|nr:hypothetical protein [Candidatus Acetatifactor stercoripullorum]